MGVLDQLAGTEIVGYRLIDRIGAGGMASVWRAEHPTIGRRVAIKIMDPGLARDSELVARFVGEAKLQVELRHPNIVCVENFSMDPLAIVMEYVEGRPLTGLVGKGKAPLSLAEALPLMQQIMDAVGFAHERGVVHRDLKPANVMVTATGQAKVVDFGIAKALDVKGRTRTGMTMGTPAYMAPEQIIAAKDADSRSDIYALGVTFYEMLAGRTPFVDAADTTSEYQIMDAQVRLPPPDPRTFQPSISDDVAAALLITLEKDPKDRFQSVEALRVALERAAGAGAGASAGAGAGASGSTLPATALEREGLNAAALAPTLVPAQPPPAQISATSPTEVSPTPAPEAPASAEVSAAPAPVEVPASAAVSATPAPTPAPAAVSAAPAPPKRGTPLGLVIGLSVGLVVTAAVATVVFLATRGEDPPPPGGEPAVAAAAAPPTRAAPDAAPARAPDAAVPSNAPTPQRPWVVVAKSPSMTPAGRRVAYRFSARARAAGFARATVLDGRRYPNFRCCFWVVTVGAFPTRAEAVAQAQTFRSAGFRAYVKHAFKGRFARRRE